VQVDNPLILPVDPVFLGYHLRRESLFSSKSVRKTDPSERVGVFARVDGRSAILEYSELTPTQASRCEADGSLAFAQGNIAAHCIDLGFARRMADTALPVHRARKRVPYVDASGIARSPDTPNATKFETFLFDALPLADRSLVLETRREDEFSPIKNAEGSDSPATARRDLEGAFRRFMAGIGAPAPTVGAVEIPPLTAPDEYEFRVHNGRPGDR
jgi:UDP-N-acetylglucosamine/UDP-N-acetylgalactosamine diphosphorylase